MAKRKKKKSAVAGLMDLMDDEVVEPVSDQASEPAHAAPKKEAAVSAPGTCGVCSQIRTIAYYDADENLELPGHPDRIDRPICVDCAADYELRDKCAYAVFAAMRVALEKQGLGAYEVDQAIQVAWRSFMVASDSAALIKTAKQLKVNHPWLNKK